MAPISRTIVTILRSVSSPERARYAIAGPSAGPAGGKVLVRADSAFYGHGPVGAGLTKKQRNTTDSEVGESVTPSHTINRSGQTRQRHPAHRWIEA
jgi:hypothetical protein